MAEEVVIDLNVNSSQATKSLDKFGLTVEGLKESEVEPLTFAISELEDKLYEMAAAGDTGTKEFRDMAKEVGRLKKTVLDTDIIVDGFAEGVGVSLGQSMEGAAGAFSLAQGAMGAFGTESEEVEAAMLRVQSAMAMAQGIESIRRGIQGFKALRAAIMANTVVQKVLNVVMSLNPIGLIIMAVAALGAAIYALWGPIKQLLQFFGIMEDDAIDVAAAHKKITAEYEAQMKAMKKLREQQERDHKHEMSLLDIRHKRIIEDMEEQGASAEQLTEEMRRQTEERYKDEQDGLKQTQANRKNVFNLNRDTLRKEQALYKEAKRQGEDDRAREIKDSINKKKEENEALLTEIRNHHKNVELAEENHVDKLDDIDDQQRKKEEQRYKDGLARYKEFLANKLDAAREIEDLQTALIQDEDRKRLEEARIAYERQIEEYKNNTRDKGQLEQQLTLALATYNRERGEILKGIEEQNEAEMMPMREIVEQRKDEIRETSFQKDFEASQKKKKLSDDELADFLENANTKIDLTLSSLGAINDLVQAFAKEDEVSARRAFNVNKAVGISQAVISTAQGVMAQLAVPQDALTGTNFVKAGIVAATGAAQIATIARTQFKSTSAGGAGGSIGVPSASAVAPTFDNIGDTGVNQLAQTLGQQGKQPLKTYVVSGDVTSAQSLDRKKIQNSTL